MYKKELITESQKVNIILPYIQQHTFFSQQMRDRTHFQKAHDDSIWFGNCQKVSHFSPFSYICDDKRESLSLFFLLSSFLFHTYSKYSWEYWDTCVIYDHIFLSSIHHTAQKSTQIKAISEIFPTVRLKSYFYCLLK